MFGFSLNKDYICANQLFISNLIKHKMNITAKLSTGLLVSLLGLGLTSCDPTEGTSDYTVPTSYDQFDNVDYSGQTERLDMLAEMTTYMKTGNDAANTTVIDATKLKDMYANINSPFSDADLNASTKKIRSKTVTTEQVKFDSYMDALATTATSKNMTASNGQAGIVTTNDGASSYLVNDKGVEWTQIIEKGLMGACFYYQGTSVYLGTGKMDDADNETVTPGQGTEREHHWDEAFGYFGAPEDFPTNTTNLRYWAKYTNLHEGVYPLNAKIMDAFLEGRAAISNKDADGRDQAIATARKNWELVVGATALYYLNKTIDEMGTNGDAAVKHHAMSEGYAFIMGLKYGTGASTITTANVDQILADAFGSADPLMADFYSVTTAKLEAAKTAIVGYLTELSAEKDNF